MGRQVTARGTAVSILPIDSHSCAKTVAVAASPDKLKHQPVIPVSTAVVEYDRLTVQDPHHYVHETIVVQVAERHPAAGRRFRAGEIDGLEPSPNHFREEGSFFVGDSGTIAFDRILHVAARGKQFLRAIVVEVAPSHSPTR